MTVLVDTSIWIDHLRPGAGKRSADLPDLLAARDVVTCGPVAAELLAGALEPDRAQLWALLTGIGWLELDRRGWRRLGEVSAALRAAGTTVPLTDVTIAVHAAQGGATLWSGDTDFGRVRAVLPELKLVTAP